MALCASASGRLSASTARPRGPSSTSLPSSFVGAFPCAVAARTRRRRAAALAAAARATVTVRAEARKSVLIVNTNGGGHAVIGFYFAKELLAAGHAVTVLTVGDEASDKMKKPPFSRFSVTPADLCCRVRLRRRRFRSWSRTRSSFRRTGLFRRSCGVQELTSAGGRTVWGDPADVGAAVGGASFDVVLDNNGKDLDTVRYVRETETPRAPSAFRFAICRQQTSTNACVSRW